MTGSHGTDDIEDVLSSVRRLISPEARPNAGTGILVLTPSLRVEPVAEEPLALTRHLADVVSAPTDDSEPHIADPAVLSLTDEPALAVTEGEWDAAFWSEAEAEPAPVDGAPWAQVETPTAKPKAKSKAKTNQAEVAPWAQTDEDIAAKVAGPDPDAGTAQDGTASGSGGGPGPAVLLLSPALAAVTPPVSETPAAGDSGPVLATEAKPAGLTDGAEAADVSPSEPVAEEAPAPAAEPDELAGAEAKEQEPVAETSLAEEVPAPAPEAVAMEVPVAEEAIAAEPVVEVAPAEAPLTEAPLAEVASVAAAVPEEPVAELPEAVASLVETPDAQTPDAQTPDAQTPDAEAAAEPETVAADLPLGDVDLQASATDPAPSPEARQPAPAEGQASVQPLWAGPATLTDQDGNPLTVLDEEALHDIVRQIIREELQGALGERITRNVRKLVRAEINRALEAQKLE